MENNTVSVIPMTVAPTAIDGLMLITMKQVTDARGTVREFYRQSAWVAAQLPDLGPWQQVNLTETQPGALRGLHGESMHKLVAIAAGEAFGAYVDARSESATYGAVVTVSLSPGQQVLVPRGVCNGFQSVGDSPTQYLYCFDAEWAPGMAGVAVNPLDAALGIAWPVPVDVDDAGQISAKDAGAPTLPAA